MKHQLPKGEHLSALSWVALTELQSGSSLLIEIRKVSAQALVLEHSDERASIGRPIGPERRQHVRLALAKLTGDGRGSLWTADDELVTFGFYRQTSTLRFLDQL